jgi:DNA polymerase-3 subunit delta'
MLFRSVIGHQDIKNKLIQSVKNGRISHAQLFLGPEGSGNFSLALAYIQYLFCENRQDDDSCGVCVSCLKNAKMVHPDVHFSFPFIANGSKDFSNNYISPYREAVLADSYLNLIKWYAKLGEEKKQGIINVAESAEISRKLSLKAYEGGYKVSLIWMPENFMIPAANKLLKLLEEPPDNTVIILVAQEQEKLLKTIRSRTQLVLIPRLNDDELTQGLIDKFEMEHDLAENLAAMSDGNYFMARESALNTQRVNENFELFRDWMRLCFKKDIKGVTGWVQKIATIGREKQKHFLNYGLHLIRQCAVLNYGAESLVNIGGDERVFMQKFSPFVTHKNLQQYIEAFNLAYLHIQRNANPRILFTDLSFEVLIMLNSVGK